MSINNLVSNGNNLRSQYESFIGGSGFHSTGGPTLASVWQAITGSPISDDLLEWPPDLFALTELILQRSEAHRFALSPPVGLKWPPDGIEGGWPTAVVEAGRQWSVWVEERDGAVPDILAQEWEIFRRGIDIPLRDFTEAYDWRMCQALLTLHAIADEACAGLGIALTASNGKGCVYRARGRELLARTGSLARIPSYFVRILPKVRTSLNSGSSRVLSRYACLQRPGVEARWHKVPARGPGESKAQNAHVLLLPWPLRVRESDFRPVEGSMRHLDGQPSGFFEFSPSEPLDLDLVDRMLVAARDEVEDVEVVCLPESAVDEDEIEDLEALLTHHRVIRLITGVRQRSDQHGQLPCNWVHVAVSTGEHWLRIRQHKHHRWLLDEAQIYQYHLAGALHPRISWWEAMETPRSSIQLIESGQGVTMVTLVCEDLAQIDEVANLVRSVGPTIVFTPLLDGPQLASRWAARYAGMLADDPGSAVLTLSSAGMVRRSRPHGKDFSPVVALWKDPFRGIREIALESDAQGLLLSLTADLTTRVSGDGREPVQNCAAFFDVSVYQVRASDSGSSPISSRAARRPLLDGEDFTVLTSWAEAVAEALAYAPERVDATLVNARPDAPWRSSLGIAQPSPQLRLAIDFLSEAVRSAIGSGILLTLDSLLIAIQEDRPGEHELDRLARRVLRSAVAQRESRKAKETDRSERAKDSGSLRRPATTYQGHAGGTEYANT